MFRCPGCKSHHLVYVGAGAGPRWEFNGNVDAPTFRPSVLVTYDGADAGEEGAHPAVCHSFVTEGRIEFLHDCTHALKGTTVPLGEVISNPPEEQICQR